MNRIRQPGFFLYAPVLGAVLFCTQLHADYARGLYAYTHYDYQMARKEFTRVALDGHNEAQHYLGEIYEGGVGVPIDYEQAFAWYTQAARQEHAAAQARLAALYLKGWGVKQDATSAFDWYLRSAGNGYPLAQFETGMMYARGQGTPPDEIEAYRWLTIAASYGDPDAMGAREKLAAAMTRVEISRAGLLAKEWEIVREREQR
ncbi:MAG: tetratricopeptide repeat protein [Gammaproteobacteria bacterium]